MKPRPHVNAVIGFAILHIFSGVLSERSKHVRLALQLQTSIQAEARRRNADHRIWLLFKSKRHAHRRGITAIQSLPQTITDDGDRGRARTIVGRAERAPTENMNAEYR